MPYPQLKLIAALAAFAAVLTLGTGHVYERSLRERAIERLDASIEQRLDLVRVWLEPELGGSPGALAARVREAATRAGARVSVIEADGTVIADSHVTHLDRLDNHGERPEVKAALQTGTGRARRRSASVDLDFVYQATRFESGSVLRLAESVDSVAAAVAAHRLRTWISAAVAVALAISLGLFLAWRSNSRLREARNAVRRMSAGESSARIPHRAHDALGELAREVETLSRGSGARLRELEAERNQLQAVLHGMLEGVLVLGVDGRIVLANARIQQLFDLEAEVHGKPPVEAIRNADLQDALDEAAKAEGSAVERELVLRTTPLRVLRVHAAGIATGEGTCVVAVFHDLSDIRRLETVRRDFVANASHELRTPLTAIKGFAETLLESDVPDEDRRRYLTILRENARRLGALIDDLLELSRIESQRIDLDVEPVALEPLVRTVLTSLDGTFRERSLEVRAGPLDVPAVQVDRGALRQVIENLLDNACKYTESGGSIHVEASQQDARKVVLTVRDTGIGIPEADRERIFERFYRVDKARSRAMGGTGLGLSIVRHLVEGMGGSVAVVSTPGEGSSFHVTLRSA